MTLPRLVGVAVVSSKLHLFWFGTALTGAASIASAAPAGPELVIGVTGFVPVNCEASLDVSLVEPTSGEVPLGQLREACNNPGGYRVYFDHSADLADATLIVDGRPISLKGSDPVLVSESATAGNAVRQVSLMVPNGYSGGTISFRMSTI